MLKIFVDNQELKLYGETTIPARFNNPFFGDGGSFSFDVEVPADGNGAVFEFPENAGAKRYRQPNYEARIDHMGQSYVCRCRLNRASKQSYTLNFYFEESGFYNRIKDLRIDQLNYNEEFSFEAPQIATAASPTDGDIIEVGKDTNYQRFLKNLEIIRNPNGGFSDYSYSIGPYNQVEYLDYLIKSPTDTYPYTVHFAVMINADYYPEGQNHLVFKLVTYSKPGHALQKIHLLKKINSGINQVFHAALSMNEETSVQFLVGWNNPEYYGANWYLNAHNITAFETWPAMTYPDPSEKKYSFFPTKYLHYSQEDYDGPVLNNNDLANYCYGRLSNNFIWIGSNTDYNFQEVFLGKLFPSFFIRYILNALVDLTGYQFLIPPEITDIENIVLVGQVNLVNPEYFIDPRKDLYRNHFTANEILPWVKSSELLQKLARGTGTYPVLNEVESTFEFRPFTVTIHDRSYVDLTKELLISGLEYTQLPEGFRLFYKNHPDPYFQEKYPTLEGKNLRGSVDLLSELPEDGNDLHDVFLVTSREQYFEWTGTMWAVFADWPAMELLSNVDKENIFEYGIDFWPLVSRTVFRPLLSADSLLCPMTELPVHNIITDEPTNRKNMVMVYSIYRGMQYYMLNDVEYPLLSHERQNVRGSTIANTNFAASVLGVDGLYHKRLKDYIFFQVTEPIRCRAKLNPTQALVFPKTKVMLEGIKYLVETLNWAFTADGLSDIQGTLRKVNN